MTKSSYFISLVVPALNEQEVIAETIRIYNNYLSQLFKKYEIIIVDDGSTDQTPKILRSIRKKIPHLRILTHPTNYGVGKAILDGFQAARGEWVMHNSADRPFDLLLLKHIIPLFNKSDVIVVARKDRSANSPFRKLTSLTSYILVRIMFGTPIKDFHFIQIYRKNILNSVTVHSHDVFAPAELLVKLYKMGYKINHFSAPFHGRTAGYSKYSNPIRYVRYLKDLIRLWLALRQETKTI